MDPRLTLLFLATVTLIAWRWTGLRRQVLWGAVLTLPLVVANLFLAGSFADIGFTSLDALERIVSQFVGLAAFGGILAAIYEAVASRWFNSFTPERRHHLLWLVSGLMVAVVVALLGVPLILALVIGLFINTVLVVTIDWRLFWDAILSGLGFGLLYAIADALFGFRVSGDITPLLIAPQPFGVTLAGLSPERILLLAGLGVLIGPLFAGLKRYRLPEHPTDNAPASWKIVTSATASLMFAGLAAWLTMTVIQAPRVLALSPANATEAVSNAARVTLHFSRPVNREALAIQFSPLMNGSWTFTDPDVTFHAYRTAIFTPDEAWASGVTYTGVVSGIESFWGLANADMQFTFTTAESTSSVTVLPNDHTQLPVPTDVPQPEPEPTPAPTPTPAPVATAAYHKVELSVKLDYQDQPLSCEAAALKMALAAQGVKVTESQIMKIVGYDPTPHHGNVWGDPHSAFVGNIAGKQNTTGYGVYWEPIAKAARVWRPATILTNAKLTDLTAALDAEHAVVIWGTLGTAYRDDWTTPEGKKIVTWKGEHARTLIGYTGTASNPKTFIINDPIVGRITWSAATLDANWARFSRSAVVVE